MRLDDIITEKIRTEEQTRYASAEDEKPDEHRRALFSLGDDRSFRYLFVRHDILDILKPAGCTQSESVSTLYRPWVPCSRGCGERRKETHS